MFEGIPWVERSSPIPRPFGVWTRPYITSVAAEPNAWLYTQAGRLIINQFGRKPALSRVTRDVRYNSQRSNG